MSPNITDTQYFAILCANYYLHNLSCERATVEQRLRSLIAFKTVISLLVYLTLLKN